MSKVKEQTKKFKMSKAKEQAKKFKMSKAKEQTKKSKLSKAKKQTNKCNQNHFQGVPSRQQTDSSPAIIDVGALLYHPYITCNNFTLMEKLYEATFDDFKYLLNYQ